MAANDPARAEATNDSNGLPAGGGKVGVEGARPSPSPFSTKPKGDATPTGALRDDTDEDAAPVPPGPPHGSAGPNRMPGE